MFKDYFKNDKLTSKRDKKKERWLFLDFYASVILTVTYRHVPLVCCTIYITIFITHRNCIGGRCGLHSNSIMFIIFKFSVLWKLNLICDASLTFLTMHTDGVDAIAMLYVLIV